MVGLIGKRGISPIIAVVLLLMITVVAATIIVAFVVPFTKENLRKSEECFNALGKLEFAQTPYNCFDDGEASDDKTGFSVKNNDDKIKGFSISLEYKGNANSYDIEENSEVQGIKMLLSGNALVVPKKGETRSYVINGLFENMQIYPILENGRRCDVADVIKINQCLDESVINDLRS